MMVSSICPRLSNRQIYLYVKYKVKMYLHLYVYDNFSQSPIHIRLVGGVKIATGIGRLRIRVNARELI